jgi:Domain of unknown function (DUF4440)
MSFARAKQGPHLLLAGAAILAVAVGTSAYATTTAKRTIDAPVVGATTRTDAVPIRAVEHRLLHALLAKNYDTVDKLLANDFELITPTGDVVSKDVYLSGTAFTYRRFKPITRIRVRVYGKAAIIRYEATIQIRGGISGRDWHTDLFEKRAGRWQMVWSQATAAA